jgi:Ca-activated chloride channel family protein
MRGRLPVKDAVRVEEFINTFDYGYAQPDKRSQPFSVTTELAPTPWNPKTHLLMIGLKGYVLAPAEIPPANLVFLIDVSGSMQGADRLDLIKESLQLLVTELRPQDRVSVVVYSGRTAALLEGVPGNEKPRIRQIIDSLYAEGSTAGGQAIQMAYDLAARNFIPKGVNRIILATDGDFNVGVTDVSHLTSLIEEKRKTGVSLSLLGVGRGNINDRLMEKLADAGNGKYDFLDSVREGKRVLVQQMAGTLATIAKDVKLQVEFNPRRVAEYRLIGYENRALKREDFANDKVDAGDLGAGHTVTALYEVALAGSGGERLPALRYQSGKEPEKTARNEEYAHIALRYKLPGQDTSTQVNVPVKDAQRKASGSPRFNLAAGVAAFAQRLRGGTYLNDFGWLDITRLVESAGSIADAPRAELLNLIFTAKDLSSSPAQEKTGQ